MCLYCVSYKQKRELLKSVPLILEPKRFFMIGNESQLYMFIKYSIIRLQYSTK